jgi:hypothetical protein
MRSNKRIKDLQAYQEAEAEAEEAEANGSIIISFTRTPTGYDILFNNNRILATIGDPTDYQYTFGGLLDTGEVLAMSTTPHHIDTLGTTLPLEGMLESLEKNPAYGYTFFGIKREKNVLTPDNKNIRDVIEIWIPLCKYFFVYHIKLTQIKPEQSSGIGPDLNTAFGSVSGIPLNKKKGKTTTYYLTPDIIINALILFVREYGDPTKHNNILIFNILRQILYNQGYDMKVDAHIDRLIPELKKELLTQRQAGGSRKLRSKRRKRKNSSKRKRKTNKRKRRRT